MAGTLICPLDNSLFTFPRSGLGVPTLGLYTGILDPWVGTTPPSQFPCSHHPILHALGALSTQSARKTETSKAQQTNSNVTGNSKSQQKATSGSRPGPLGTKPGTSLRAQSQHPLGGAPTSETQEHRSRTRDTAQGTETATRTAN